MSSLFSKFRKSKEGKGPVFVLFSFGVSRFLGVLLFFEVCSRGGFEFYFFFLFSLKGKCFLFVLAGISREIIVLLFFEVCSRWDFEFSFCFLLFFEGVCVFFLFSLGFRG